MSSASDDGRGSKKGKGRPAGTTNNAGSLRPGPVNATNKRRKVAAIKKNKQAWGAFGFTSPAGDGDDGGGGGGGGGGSGGGGKASSVQPGDPSGDNSGDEEEAELAGSIPVPEVSSMSGQAEFLASIKDTISKAAPRHKLQHPYPYNDMWVYPPNPTTRSNIIVGHHHRRPVFVRLPESTHPCGVPDGRLPCPLCKSTPNM
ncbi:unnamed protein product [Pylaiella littoralis]